MSFDPSASSGDDHSFIVLDRMTAEDTEKIERELTNSVHAFNLGSSVNPNVNSNHFGEVVQGPSEAGPASQRDVEVPIHISNGASSLPVGVQQKMDSLIQENVTLQVTVDETNNALRQMMTTLKQYQEDMEGVRQDHKEKFQETRALVLQLKKEKADMRQVIESLHAKIDELETKQMPSLFETLIPTVNEIQLKSTISALEVNLTTALAAQEAEKRTAEAVRMTESDELIALRSENLRLKCDVTNLCSVERHSQDYQVAQAKGFTNRIDELTAKLMLNEEELQKAETEIAQLTAKLQEGAQSNTEEAYDKAMGTVKRLRLRIDEMTASIVELREKCERQEKQIADHQEAKRIQDESIGILLAQVEVYRADFIAERDCRQRLAGEKEQLAGDLRRLHRLNVELQNQQPAQSNMAVEGSQEERNTNEENLENAAGEAEQNGSFNYRCPICNHKNFRTEEAVNEHIDRCLDGFIDIP